MKGRGSIVATALAVALGLVTVAERAGAELYRCKGPDGQTLYTDNQALCPGAEAFEPQGEVQAAPGREAEAAPASRGSRLERAEARRLAEEAEKGEAARWRRKREEAEQAIEALAGRRAQLDRYVTWCHRGGTVSTRDDAGIKRKVSCDAIEQEYAALDTREAELRHYLESELPEECRRAGCLPGWIR
jgi:hypothetical protein